MNRTNRHMRHQEEERTKKKFGKLRWVIIAILILLGVICIGAAFLWRSLQPTPVEERVVPSEDGVQTQLFLPNATPSRAITRTMPEADWNALSAREKADLWETVAPNLEGDMPRLLVSEGKTIMPVFQDQVFNNLKSSGGSYHLRLYDSGHLDSDHLIDQQKGKLTNDEGKLSFDFDDEKLREQKDLGIPVATLEMHVTINQTKYVAITAFSVFLEDPLKDKLLADGQ